MPRIIPVQATTSNLTSHKGEVFPVNLLKSPGSRRIKSRSRLPLNRLIEARGMNSEAGKPFYAAGFGDATPPDPRPRCPVVMFKGVGR